MTGQQVLQVSLDTTADVQVRLSLLTDQGAGWATVWSVVVGSDEIGLPTLVSGDPIDDGRFRLPAVVATGLPPHLSDIARVTWLQLREPFGYLGMVPWEQLLAPVVPGPVLRLPSIDLGARVPSDDLQVALLAVAPDPDRQGAAAEYLHGRRIDAGSRLRSWTQSRPDAEARDQPAPPRSLRPDEHRLTADGVGLLVDAILRGSPRRTTVHVVTTPRLFHELRARWRDRTWPVHLHPPPATGAATGSDWFSQVRAAMGGEQADVVHLVCGASVSGAKVRLAMADVPDGTGQDGSRFVSLSTLRRFLDAVGAWSVHLTAAPGDLAVPALRLAAARLVEERPGPVVLTDLATDLDAAEVRAAYRFLCRTEPTVPPTLSHTLVGCEPHRVRGGEGLAADQGCLLYTSPSPRD